MCIRDRMNAEANDMPQNWFFTTESAYDTATIFTQFGTPGLANDAVILTPPPPLSINNELDGQVELFPNPASDVITIESEVQGDVQIQMFDITGKQMTQFQFDNNRIDVSNLPIGVYTVQLSIDAKSTVQKIIIQR